MIINAERVRELRELKGWSQELLAEAAGLGVRTVQRIEAQGGASRESVLCIAAALNVAVTELQLASGSTTTQEPAPTTPVRAGAPLLIRIGMTGIYSARAAWGFMWLTLAMAAASVLIAFLTHDVRFYWGAGFTAAALWYFAVAHWMTHHLSPLQRASVPEV